MRRCTALVDLPCSDYILDQCSILNQAASRRHGTQGSKNQDGRSRADDEKKSILIVIGLILRDSERHSERCIQGMITERSGRVVVWPLSWPDVVALGGD